MRRSASGGLVVVAFLVAACTGGVAGEAADVPKRIGILRSVATTSRPGSEQAMLLELSRAGMQVGEEIELLSDPDETHPESDDAEAAVRRWIRRDVDLIVALSTTGALAAKRVAPRVPVVFLVNDPVATGLVSDPRAPDRGMTGLSFEVPADRTLHLARRAIGDLTHIGMAYPAEDPAAAPNRLSFAAAAADLGLSFTAHGYDDGVPLEEVVDALVASGVQALVASTSPTAVRALDELEVAAAGSGLPTLANVDLATFALVTLYPDREEVGRQLGRQVLRLLRGAEPSDVPVEAPRRFRLTLNAAAAAAFGIELPPSLMREADLVRR